MLLYTCVLLGALVLILGTEFKTTPDSSGTQREAEPHIPQRGATVESPLEMKLAAASRSEVESTLRRIYKGALLMDQQQKPAYLTGDFNGDGSQDLVVIIRPNVQQLATLNSPLANWIVQDLARARHAANIHKRPPEICPRDRLLAVVHGYGEEGWRNPEARQTYLVRNALGEDMRARHWEELLPSSQEMKSAPMTGDIIAETIDKQSGFLYWDGAKYAWHAHTEAPVTVKRLVPK